MSSQEFRLPDVGEGLTEAEIVAWLVQPGDTVAINDVLVEIETEKSLVELPSPFAGIVEAHLVPVGLTVAVGTPIIAIAVPDSDQAVTKPTATKSEPEADVEAAPSVLVGYGPSEGGSTRRPRKTAATSDAVADTAALNPWVLSTPPVRKLARDLEINLADVPPKNANGVITRDDVLAFEAHRTALPTAGKTSPASDNMSAGHTEMASPGETRFPIKGVRKATAEAMTESAFTAPHATEFLTIDTTRSMKLVHKLAQDPRFEGVRVTLLLLIAKAMLTAAKEFPEINASWDAPNDEIVQHHRVNLGIAAATPRGLLVPNIKAADRMTLQELSSALVDLIRVAREGKTTLPDMSRGTMTITNIGVFGIDAATPILNPGEAAILCVGASKRRPWEHKGKIALRWTMTLSLSFDHRLVDGELGSKFLARVGAILENPQWELLLG